MEIGSEISMIDPCGASTYNLWAQLRLMAALSSSRVIHSKS